MRFSNELFQANTNKTNPMLISAHSALKLHNDVDTIFVDVRSAQEIAQSGTIKGALRAPLPEFSEHAKADGSGLLPEQATDKLVICVCASGMRSANAAQQLLDIGYQNVANLGGGIGTWIEVGGPIEK